ncbi:MAG: bifunctional metallophosphatase/5'-nucleotidase [Planctomycetota bacterium]|jgi:2',3'-cyclic-nucleotide 2'-phosphodiesterase (5'-nucleotidase family)
MMKRMTLAAVAVCTAAGAVSGAGAPRPVTVTIYHTSDLHEHSGPLPRVAELVARRKKEDPNVLFVDTGDWCNKGDLTALGTRGEAIVAMMAAAKYDAVIPGNHEFTFGPRRLVELVDRYSVPMLTANCEWSRNVKPRRAAKYRVYKLKGVTVAVVGTAPPFASAAKGPAVKIRPIAAAVKPLIAELDRKADIIVLLTHVGPPDDKKLVRALPRVDVILGGHHHRRFSSLNFDRQTKTILQHSGQFGEAVGEVTITWDGKRITDRKARLIKITNDMPESEAVKAVREKYVPRKAAQARGEITRPAPFGTADPVPTAFAPMAAPPG